MATKKVTTKPQIVVLQRGWVVVGDVSQEGEEIVVNNASVVRKWGTTKGLGELAERGPLNENGRATVLDKSPQIRAHNLTVIMRVDCKEDAWRAHLS